MWDCVFHRLARIFPYSHTAFQKVSNISWVDPLFLVSAEVNGDQQKSKAALKSTNAMYAFRWNSRVFSINWRIVKICSVVDLPGMNPA
jgi:hypothetical protein